jgi:transcriptional regulator with XRE-family HTH domain
MLDRDVNLADKVGAFIRSLRKVKGLTQAEFSNYVDISSRTLYSIEMGDRLPNGQEAINISSFFGITIDELLSAGGMVSLRNRHKSLDDLEEMRSEISEFAAFAYSFYRLSNNDKQIIIAIIYKMLGSELNTGTVDNYLSESNKIREKVKSGLKDLDETMGHLDKDIPNAFSFISKLFNINSSIPTEIIYYFIASLDTGAFSRISAMIDDINKLDDDDKLNLILFALDSIKKE